MLPGGIRTEAVLAEMRAAETPTHYPKSGSQVIALLGRIGGIWRYGDTKTEHC
jgi:hypothetical protein